MDSSSRRHRRTLAFRRIAWLATSAIVGGTASAQDIPTFAEEIAPLIHSNCAECHRPGGAGPFSLLEFGDAAKRAKQIAEVTGQRFMPPWKPQDDFGPPLAGSRRLSTEQIELLRRWAEAGAPAGDLETAPKPPDFPEAWALGEPDMVLQLPVRYIVPAQGGDIHRNFVIPLPGTEGRRVRAAEFRPGTPAVIHHAIVLMDDTGWARKRDAADPLPGFDGMELSGASMPSGHLADGPPARFRSPHTPGQRGKSLPVRT